MVPEAVADAEVVVGPGPDDDHAGDVLRGGAAPAGPLDLSRLRGGRACWIGQEVRDGGERRGQGGERSAGERGDPVRGRWRPAQPVVWRGGEPALLLAADGGELEHVPHADAVGGGEPCEEGADRLVAERACGERQLPQWLSRKGHDGSAWSSGVSGWPRRPGRGR